MSAVEFLSDAKDVFLAIVGVLSALSGWLYARRKAREDENFNALQSLYNVLVDAYDGDGPQLNQVRLIKNSKPRAEIYRHYLPTQQQKILDEAMDPGIGSLDMYSVDKFHNARKRIVELREWLKEELSKR